MDILGPYASIDAFNSLYVVTAIDAYSRYAVTLATVFTPTSDEVVAVFRDLHEMFHVCPDVCQTDKGSQFKANDFCQLLKSMNCLHLVSPTATSWTNGKIERLHRTFNERLRAHNDQPWATERMLFKRLIKQITIEYNISYSEQLQRSPHEAIFTFQPWIYPQLKKYRKQPLDQMTKTSQAKNTKKSKYPIPNIGELWKVKRKNTRKSENIYEPCEITDRISYHLYKIRLLRNNTTTISHIRNLAKISTEDYEQYRALEIPSERPLRNPRGGGGI
jgi:transposase InsO family protein